MIEKTKKPLDSPCFPHYDPIYKCCCGAVHVRQGSEIIGFVSAVFILFSAGSLIFSPQDDGTGLLVFEIVTLIIDVAIVVLLFIGLKKENAHLLLPFIVYQGLWIVGCSILSAIFFWVVTTPESAAGRFVREQMFTNEDSTTALSPDQETTVIRLAAAFLVFVLGIAVLLSAWWGYVVFKCYHYFKDLKTARGKKQQIYVDFQATPVY